MCDRVSVDSKLLLLNNLLPLLLVIGKTFAFMDIDISERELQRCRSVYSKAKWKGQTVTIQQAKESFLTRRERECREGSFAGEDQKRTARPSSLIKKSAVERPCNAKPIGKWTKGAGGRMTPSVLRMNVGTNKVVVCSPSQHSHRVKQLSNIGPVNTPVVNLTWTLDCESTAVEETTNKEGSAGEMSTDSEGSAGEEDTNSERSMLQVDDGNHSATFKACSGRNVLPTVSCTPVPCAFDDCNAAPILSALLKHSQCRPSEKMSPDTPTVSGCADTSPLPLTTCRTLSSIPNDSNLVPIMKSLQSSPSAQYLKQDTVDVHAVCSRARRKKEQSEQQRKRAVEELVRRAERKGWQHTSMDSHSMSKRILFSSSSDVGSSEEDKGAAVVDKDSDISELDTSVPERHIRMALFNSSGSEGEQEEEDPEELISEKPQFAGKAGAKLFKLQQKFSRDKRFQLDERFLSDTESDMELQRDMNTPLEEEEEDALLSKQIQEEKMMQNSIIDQILGFQSVRTYPQSTMLVARKDLGDFLPKRYDPSAVDHQVMEFDGRDDASVDDSDSQCDEAGKAEPSDNSNEGDKMVAQGEELKKQYYSIQSDLKDAFHQKDIQDRKGSVKVKDSFSFAALFDSSRAVAQLKPNAADHRDEGKVEEDGRQPKPLRWLTSTPDSSSEDECDDAGGPMNDKGTRELEVSDLFFFHPYSDQLRNRLVSSEGVFMRQKPLDELERGWPQLRMMYKKSYKQRRRDAQRWSKKMKDSKSHKS